MNIKHLLTILLTSQVLILQAQESFTYIKVGGSSYQYETGIPPQIKKIRATSYGFSLERKFKSHQVLTYEAWGSVQNLTGDAINNLFMVGLQVNWYPFVKWWSYNFFHISTGVCYLNQGDGQYEGIGVSAGPGVHYLVKNKLLIFADADLVYYYDWKSTKSRDFFTNQTPLIIGIGWKLNHNK